MSKLINFSKMLTGYFDNSEQIKRYQNQQIFDYPKAEHRNTICNDKIYNLPQDFNGIFLLEESYYTIKGNTNSLPHLFLLTENDGFIKLESYEIPSDYDKNSFTYDNLGKVDYNSLKKSEKFNPLIYKEENGTFKGKSVSMFTPILKFTIDETLSKDLLLVSEIFEVNGKRTFGYDDPIEYKRVKR